MKNLWNNKIAATFKAEPMLLRVYSSQLLGQNPNLVLHGGGNTSVKIQEKNFFGEEEKILFIKGSGHDLAKIASSGFTSLKLEYLQRLAKLKYLKDSELLLQQKLAMTNPESPPPSLETLLHAIIPYAWIDHTHADALITLTNTQFGEDLIRKIYAEKLLIIPYLMPGFKLAQKVFQLTQNIDWNKFQGILLLNHGIITFGQSAKESYERMINFVSEAENYLEINTKPVAVSYDATNNVKDDLLTLAKIRKQVSLKYGSALLAQWQQSPEARGFSKLKNVKELANRGPMTSDHLIRTKPFPVIIDSDNIEKHIDDYATSYAKYFSRNCKPHHTCLDKAPRSAIWVGKGNISFGKNLTDTMIISDIIQHTIDAIQQSESLGGWIPIIEEHIFEAEYWDLQQAKLKIDKEVTEFEGKVAIVSGAASGIGLACARELHEQGVVVVGIDLNPEINNIFNKSGMLGIVADVTNNQAIQDAVQQTILRFGGLDILVLNAGTFPAGQTIEDMDTSTWEKSLAINLTAPQQLLQACIPYLKEGIDPAVVFMASRNVPAPGPGASAYSVPKAGQTQMARIAALELGEFGIRVNTLHPDCVYDTGLWTPETLARSAKRYGLSIEEYKSRNVLKKDVTSEEVAKMVCAMAGSVFAKTTGAQVPIDGGNDRVI